MKLVRSLSVNSAGVRGHSVGLGLVLAAAVAIAALACWTLLSDSTAPPAPAERGDTPAASGTFRYADEPDQVLFRVDEAVLATQASAPSTRDGMPIRINRRTALASAHRGTMAIELPDGSRYPVRYERSENAPGGNWTFIGRVATSAGDLSAVITFGKEGVFGLLPTPDGRMMQVTTRAGQAYLKPAAGLVPRGVDPARKPDFVLPPKGPASHGPRAQAAAPSSPTGNAMRAMGAPMSDAPVGQSAAPEDGLVTIELLAAYTTNLVEVRGTTSAVETEYRNLLALTNLAHVESGSRARFVISGFVEVDLPATAWNGDLLRDITNNEVPGVDLHALRDAAAADLVTLIRPYAEGDPSCGTAWLGAYDLGGYAMSPSYGFSVSAVGDCTPLALAHEIGHNLGLHHDRETVMDGNGGHLEYGAFPFSFGYRQDGPPAFATVMAYDTNGQERIIRFSHPDTLACEGTACGVPDIADNVRSINLTAATTSRYRDPPGTISVLDAWVLEEDDGASYVSFQVRLASPAPPGGVTFDVVVEGGSATLGVDVDGSGDGWTGVSIPEGRTTTSFSFAVLPDNTIEVAESFNVHLANVEGAAVYDGDAIMTIIDDDATVPVEGQLRFPFGTPKPTRGAYIYVNQVVAGVNGYLVARVDPPDFRYRFNVARGAAIELLADSIDEFVAGQARLERVDAPVEGLDVQMVEPIDFSGRVLLPDDVDMYNTPVTLWNRRGNGQGWYINGGDWDLYTRWYRTWVFPGVPTQLEIADPPAPYVRQLVEIPPLHASSVWNIELREVPSLTIAHEVVDEGSAADGMRLVAMTAELSVAAPPGGITFDLGAGGTAEAVDAQVPAGTFSIAEGATSVAFTVAVRGDALAEPDEVVELRVSNIRGAAWNPGPGSVRIADDDGHATVADFNGDGRSDILWRNTDSGANAIWRDADFQSRMSIAGVTNLDWEMAGTGDFDGDGRSGIAWRNRATGANVIWRSAQYRDPVAVPGVRSTDWQIRAVADFDGNGRADLLWRNVETGVITIWESASPEGQGATARAVGLGWRIAGTGDLDGDGRDDILWRHASKGANVVWRAGGAKGHYALASADVAMEVAGIGDFDGDDRADIAWRNRDTGANAVWPRADAARSRAIAALTDQAWVIEAVGDYDGDGVADLLWRSSATGGNVLWPRADAGRLRALAGVRDLAWQVMP